MLTQRTSKAKAKGPVQEWHGNDRSLKKAQRKAMKAQRADTRRRQRILEKREARKVANEGIFEYEDWHNWA